LKIESINKIINKKSIKKPKLLVENLNTQVNNYIDFTNIELKQILLLLSIFKVLYEQRKKGTMMFPYPFEFN